MRAYASGVSTAASFAPAPFSPPPSSRASVASAPTPGSRLPFPAADLQPRSVHMSGNQFALEEWTTEVREMVVPVRETTRAIVEQYDYDFPYHDVCYGTGWRFHHPDNLDENVLHLHTPKTNPLIDLQHAAFMRAAEVAWHKAHFIETDPTAAEHRWPPGARRVREPEQGSWLGQASLKEVMF
mmetsp:Transcript_20988/g.65634  ORF Transcript_20988/g.65634 Transcript_20988/m.65634 type:complete len:183 (+) Transcript_20988:61-609(+)|eukprot:CAMPEP_0204599670 /NCGR_PEP_ID=MMETSP0661-20131031/54969_1 /ASSEMBLY_ACC=CAM_ASM_000606 /TAXON_ID=109239 /ORGANISM="Alexandrium margalefi, Strain AMGDE01CS-322" /LENGTH=182 /DNA_ID=CAMNT_0051610417 /DNA_START=61 /DNA_END=609 /DNA_ORIENTATION=-